MCDSTSLLDDRQERMFACGRRMDKDIEPMKFSVLIAVYAKETPAHLAQSLESIFRQDLPPDEVILVEDGPLTAALDEVIDRFKEQHEILHTVKLPQNQGLGLALKEGLTHCQYDIVARMDSDDISKPQRFSKEMAWMEAHPETDIVGSWTDEFADESGKVISTRRLPEDHEALLRFSRYRNPMNHPTVMFRKAAVEQAGSYRHRDLFEDYDLWIRMLQQGARFHNLQESLLMFRLSPQLYSRRGGRHYIRREIAFQRWMHEVGHINGVRLVVNITIRTLIRLIPEGLRIYGYLFFLRRQ